jgi:quercetin dioxygenase-like cupin family protein
MDPVCLVILVVMRVIENPRTGERIVILRSGAETGGELLEFDTFLQPGAHVPASHVHPTQEERFTVLRGKLRFRVGRRAIIAAPGTSVTIASGTDHWFGNVGENVAQVRVEVRPALRMEELLESSARRSGLMNWALIALDFQRELAIPHVPAWLVLACLTPLAWLRSSQA